MSRALLVVLALTGCDRVFGVAYSDSGEPAVVTGQVTRDEVRNDASFQPVHQLGTVEDLTIDVRFADGTSQSVEVASDGTFTFETPDRAPYRLRMRSATSDVELQQFAEQLTVVYSDVGRRDRVPVDGTEQIMISAMGVLAPGDQLWFSTTGVYSNGRLAPQLAQKFAYGPPAIQALFSSPLGRLDASAHDRSYLTVFRQFTDVGEPTFAHLALRDVLEGALTMTGGETTLSGALQPAPPEDQLPCREVVPTARLEAARLAALRPYDSVTVRWSMKALIAPTTAPFAAMLLAFSGQTRADPNDIDEVPMTVRIHDPYPGTEIAFEAIVIMEHEVELDAAAPISLPTVSSQLAPIGTELACSPIGSTPTIGLPAMLSLAGQPLSTDGGTVTLPGDPTVEVTWDMAVRGIGDLWSMTLHRLHVDDMNRTVTEPLRSWRVPSGDERAFAITVDTEDFVAGETYALRLVHSSGNPNVDEGDYSMFESPAQSIATWSSTFVVE